MDQFLRYCHLKNYPANALIIRTGDSSNELFYLMEGSISVSIHEEAHDIVLAYLHEGDFFGEIGMFDEQHQRSAQVRSRTKCRVARINYNRLRELLNDSPEILFEMLSQLATRLRDTSRQVGHLAFLDVAGRVASALMSICREPDAVTDTEGVRIRITRQELARIAGCSREAVGRVLKDLETQGLLTSSGRNILVHHGALPRNWQK
jgi:CRP/FNR family transcriptional regulator, cyclic AMP receptor protein